MWSYFLFHKPLHLYLRVPTWIFPATPVSKSSYSRLTSQDVRPNLYVVLIQSRRIQFKPQKTHWNRSKIRTIPTEIAKCTQLCLFVWLYRAVFIKSNFSEFSATWIVFGATEMRRINWALHAQTCHAGYEKPKVFFTLIYKSNQKRNTHRPHATDKINRCDIWYCCFLSRSNALIRTCSLKLISSVTTGDLAANELSGILIYWCKLYRHDCFCFWAKQIKPFRWTIW